MEPRHRSIVEGSDDPSHSRKPWWPPLNGLSLLVAAAFVSRLALAFWVAHLHGTQGWLTPDSPSYLNCARGLLDGAFASGGKPEIARTPGYPLLLVPGVLFEIAPLYAVVVNSLVSAAVLWLVWRLTWACTGSRGAALAASILYLLEPVSWIMATKVAPETVFSALILLFVALFLRFLRSGMLLHGALAAVVLAASAYVRPVSIYLGVFLAPLALFYPRTLPFSRRILAGIVFQACFAALILPWCSRNRRQAEFTGFASISDQALYYYSAASVNARLQSKSFEQMQTEMGWLNWQGYLRTHPEQKDWSSGRVALSQRAEAKRIIRENMAIYVPIHLKGCAVMLLDPGATELLKLLKLYPSSGGMLGRIADKGLLGSAFWLIENYPSSIAALAATGLLLFIAYLGGAVGLARVPRDVALLMAALAVYFVATSGGPMAVARYRHPLVPVLFIAAGAGLGAIRQRISLSRNPQCR